MQQTQTHIYPATRTGSRSKLTTTYETKAKGAKLLRLVEISKLSQHKHAIMLQMALSD